MTDKEFIEFYDWLKIEVRRYALPSSGRYDEILDECLRFWEWLKERNINPVDAKEYFAGIIRSAYENKKKNCPYSAKKIINVGNYRYFYGEHDIDILDIP